MEIVWCGWLVLGDGARVLGKIGKLWPKGQEPAEEPGIWVLDADGRPVHVISTGQGGPPFCFCQSRVKKSLMPFGPEPNNAIIRGYLHTMPPATSKPHLANSGEEFSVFLGFQASNKPSHNATKP